MEAKTELKYILATVNDMLKFAEAKNGGLIIFNSGLVIGILSSYNNIHSAVYKWVILFGIVCFGVSVFLSIISQFPKTENIFFNKENIAKPNLYFFEHLSNLDEAGFIDAFKEEEKKFDASGLDKLVINQILVNARIAQTKFTIFKFAIVPTCIGAGAIALTTIFKAIWHF